MNDSREEAWSRLILRLLLEEIAMWDVENYEVDTCETYGRIVL
jgi:hypothetical protein